MWGKHDEVRQLLRLTIEGLQQVEALDAAEARAYGLMSVAPALDAVLEAAHLRPDLRTALFDAVSAHAPYRDIAARSLHPGVVAAFVQAAGRHLIS